jgi:hypothetical protein
VYYVLLAPVLFSIPDVHLFKFMLGIFDNLFFNFVQRPSREVDTAMFVRWLQHLYFVHAKDTAESHGEKAMLYLEKVLLHKERDEFWLMGYRVRYPTYPPHPTHRSFHGQGMHAAWTCLFLSDYDAPFHTNVGDVVSGQNIDTDILLMQR